MPSGPPLPVWPLVRSSTRSSRSCVRCMCRMTPAEELLELASDAIDESGATPADPIDCENIRGRFLPEYPFSGKTQHYKSKYAVSAAAMNHGGVYPDLLDDAAWWQADDLWTYSFFALLIYVRAAAHRTGRTVGQVALSIADRRGVAVALPDN